MNWMSIVSSKRKAHAGHGGEEEGGTPANADAVEEETLGAPPVVRPQRPRATLSLLTQGGDLREAVDGTETGRRSGVRIRARVSRAGEGVACVAEGLVLRARGSHPQEALDTHRRRLEQGVPRLRQVRTEGGHMLGRQRPLVSGALGERGVYDTP